MSSKRQPLHVVTYGPWEDPTALPAGVLAYESRHKRKPGYELGPDTELGRPALPFSEEMDVWASGPGGDVGCGPVALAFTAVLLLAMALLSWLGLLLLRQVS